MVETTFHAATGSFRQIDFAPRFMHYDRSSRPTQLMCIADLNEGMPLDGADGSQNLEEVALDHWPGLSRRAEGAHRQPDRAALAER